MAFALRSSASRLVTCLLTVVALACAHEPAADLRGDPSPLAQLSRANMPREIAPRLSIPVAYRACSSDAAEGGGVPRSLCGSDAGKVPPENVVNLVLAAGAPVQPDLDEQSLHATALVDLLWSDSAGISLRRSISYLRTVARLARRPSPALDDLSAAYLVRAERSQSPRDLLEAIEAATRALDAEPRDAVARFDLALALDDLGLDGEAMTRWRAYLEVDSTSSWAAEARAHVGAIRARTATVDPPGVGASSAQVAAYAARAPQAARLFGWDDVLGGWGHSWLTGDHVRADSLLSLAGAIGDALEARGGDATLADAVRAIRAHARDVTALRSLAMGHAAFATGETVYRAADYSAAGRALDRALAVAPASSTLVQWARLLRGATLVYGNERGRGERMLRGVLARADDKRHPALAGRARWALGTTLLRSGRHSGADIARGANALFERCGERENLGAVEFVEGEAAFDVGDAERGYVDTYRALRTLRPYASSVWRHNALFVLARAAVSDGLLRAAIHAQNEGLVVAERTGRPIYVIEARLSRARVLAAAGDTAGAARDLAAVGAAIARLTDGGARRWFEADLRLSEVTAGRARRAPDLSLLDSAVRYYTQVNNPVRLLPAMLARAEAWLTLRQAGRATADLHTAIALLERRDADINDAELRATLLDAARAVFDRAVLLHIEAGQPVEALDALERGRVSLAPVGPVLGDARRNARITAPPGTVGVEYALVGDTLLVWTVVGRTVQLSRSRVDHARLVQTAERVRTSLELRRGSAAALHADLTALYDWLVRPVDRRVGGGMPLVVAVDGEIAGVPFAALYDSAAKRYLVEAHPLRFVPALRDASPLAAAPVPRDVLLIGEAALDRKAFPGLEPLPGAAAELRAVAEDYERPEVLTGAAAERERVAAALARAPVVHFAGHAVFDDERPEASFLALAARPGGSGRLTATDVASLHLGRVRLVVLSACETMRAHAGRSGGFSGLTGAFLAAGARGVVGSLWRVDDTRTLELMRDFHHEYRSSGDAALALRAAQLRQLHSPDSLRASPAAWSGFRYAGH